MQDLLQGEFYCRIGAAAFHKILNGLYGFLPKMKNNSILLHIAPLSPSGSDVDFTPTSGFWIRIEWVLTGTDGCLVIRVF
jgi:hypothetical protein